MTAESQFISVPDAASRLELHPSRVRALVHAHELQAERIAGRWLIHRASLERRQHADVVDGRPYNAANAWAILRLVEGQPVDWVSPSGLSRLRSKLRSQDLLALAPRLRSRAHRMSYQAHPAALRRIAAEPEVVKSGISAALQVGIDIQGGEELEAYVSEASADALVTKYHLDSSDRPNLVLHVVDNDVPVAWRGCVGPACIAIDLLESGNPRSRRAAIEFLKRLELPESLTKKVHARKNSAHHPA